MISPEYQKLAEKYKVTWDSEADEPEVIKYLDEVKARDEKRAASLAEFTNGIKAAEDKQTNELKSMQQNYQTQSKQEPKAKVPQLLECLKEFI